VLIVALLELEKIVTDSIAEIYSSQINNWF